MNTKIFMILLTLMSCGIVSADYTVGPNLGGSEWGGNSSFDNTTTIRATDNIELQQVVDDYVAHWRFDEGSGNVVHDENATNVNDGSFTDGSTGNWTSSARYGSYAMEFDGSNDLINCGNGESLNITSTITITAWVYPGAGGYQSIVGKGGFSDTYWFALSTTLYKLSAYLDGVVNYNTNAWDMWEHSKWQHVVVTYDSNVGSDNLNFYVNGSLRETSTQSGSISHTAGSLYIGKASSYLFNGTIDDVRIFNRALSNTEVNQTRDNERVATGNRTTWHDALGGNETYNMIINATGNWSGYYRQNATGNFVSHVSDQLGNQSVAISGSKYQNTDYRVKLLDGDDQELYGITFETQASGGTPDPINLVYTRGTTWVNWTWNPGTSGNDTDTYNRSINGSWGNGTASEYYNHTGLSPGLYSEIIVYAWNSTYSELSSGYVTDNVSTTGAAPTITSYTPTVTIWPEVGDSQKLNVTTNQPTNCTWYINGSQVQYNTSATEHTYTNTSLEGGHWNFTASVNNTNGSDTQTWLFEVGADSISYIVLSEDDTNLTCLVRWNMARIGSNITTINTSYSNTTAGYKYCKNFDNGTEILNQTASMDDEELWFNSSTLLPVGIYYISVCESTPGISNVQNGSISSTSQWINWTVNQTANNRVIYDTGVVSADSTACDGQWSATHACANASDGNWSSYAESAGALLAYAYFNYTVPSGANRSESLWHVKDNTGQANLTIPSACWGSTLYLRAMCSDIGNSATWQCDNGPGWTTLRTSVANIIYEEEMTFKYTSTWNNSTAAPNITLTGLTASTTYNFHARSYNLANDSLSGNSSTYRFTTAVAPYNYIYTGADEYIGFNNWSSDSTFLQIAMNESNDVCYSYYNSTSGLWEAYRAGYTYGATNIIPVNCSVFVFVNAETTISATPNTGNITLINNSWFYTYLTGSTTKTLTQIKTSMDADSADVWAIYRFENSTQTYNTTGNVEPNEGIVVYVNNTVEWDNN